MLEDQLLIRRLRRGEKAALRLIYEKYKDNMLTIANNLLLDFAGAEDCLHDVFVDFAGRAGEFRLRSNLKGYLVTCVANRARDLLRAKSPQNVPLSAVPEQREVIVLHMNGKLKFRQIASHLGLSINTVQSRYRYGLDKLRSLLKAGAEL